MEDIQRNLELESDTLFEKLKTGEVLLRNLIDEIGKVFPDPMKAGTRNPPAEYLYKLLDEREGFTKELFCNLVEKDFASNVDLKLLLEKIGKDINYSSQTGEEAYNSLGVLLLANSWLIPYCYANHLFSVEEMLELLKDCKEEIICSEENCLRILNTESFDKKSLQVLVEFIDSPYALKALCGWSICLYGAYQAPVMNSKLLKNFLENFLDLDLDINNLNEIALSGGSLKFREKNFGEEKVQKIHDIFDLIDFYLQKVCRYSSENYVYKAEYVWYERRNADEINLDLQNLNTFNRFSYNLNLDSKTKREALYDLITNNEVAKNRLKQIVENHLESNFDFDSLMKYLKKTEKKNLINI